MTVDQARRIACQEQCSLGDIVNGTKLRQGLPSRQDLGEGGFCRADGEIGGVAIELEPLAKIPVATGPGEMQLTRMPFSPSSTAAQRVK
jgi:hypothetical protein